MQRSLFESNAPTQRGDEPASEHGGKGIGGSELAAIFGLHPHMTPHELWRVKTGRPISRPQNAAMRRGVRLEPLVRHLYERHTGERLRKGWRGRHPEWSGGVVMRAMTDGLLSDGGIFEAKTTHQGSQRARAFLSGRVPTWYALQLQHYAAVCQADGVIACLCGPDHPSPWTGEPWKMAIIRWRRLPELSKLLEDAVRQWATAHLVADEPPGGAHPAAADVQRLLSSAAWCEAARVVEGERLPEAPRKTRQLTLF